MGHGHDHAGHGHEHAGHAHHDAGHGAAHGGEPPPAPAVRHITPAPEDFARLPGAGALAWPTLWIVLAAVVIAALLSGGWHDRTPGHGQGAHVEGGH
jgi:hypothetical protein